MRELAAEHAGPILVAEPHIEVLPEVLRRFPQVTLVGLDKAIERADVVVLLVNHKIFGSAPRPAQGKQVIDTRGMWR